MGRRWRWATVAAGVAVLVALPLAIRALPAGSSRIGARPLLARIIASGSVQYAGYAQSQGGLTLPVSTGDFSVLGDLFGGTSRLRVWWRGPHDWRVDALGLTGESDVAEDGQGVWTWDYEAGTARRTDFTGAAGAPGAVDSGRPAVRLPRSDDLLPATLGRRLLSEADPARVSRIADARVAGEDAAGLRLDVGDPHSTLDHIDVWARPEDGLPLRVTVYAVGGQLVISTSYLDVTVGRPPAGTTAFRPSGGKVESGEFTDIVAAIDRFGRSRPPDSVAGLPRRTDLQLGAVGVYGRGVNLLVVVPLSAHLAGEFVPPLRRTPGAVENDSGIAVAVGPLNLQLSHPYGFGARWLLIGTLTPAALTAAVARLPEAHGFGFD